ncbi:hypothetical protein N657DRAFT_165649 [Parathielavia appendiculata]|uniref:Uncharacterized protein n=1 Tax=Parathielavia appendiculata TaxID=2587402 RepID=A0AAN6TU96_9PEZI|nr:hypothetical protein N657DRAFT_165649 [Parathielavia appendiculata]
MLPPWIRCQHGVALYCLAASPANRPVPVERNLGTEGRRLGRNWRSAQTRVRAMQPGRGLGLRDPTDPCWPEKSQARGFRATRCCPMCASPEPSEA